MKRLKINMDKGKTFKEGVEEFLLNCKARGSDEELEKLLKKPSINKCNFVEYMNYVMVSMFLSTGIRISSLTNIRVKDINFNDEVVNIMHTKNRKSLIIP